MQVTATTRRAVQTLRDGIASGPVLREPLVVGEKTVPKGYKILVGPHSQAAGGRVTSVGGSSSAFVLQSRGR